MAKERGEGGDRVQDNVPQARWAINGEQNMLTEQNEFLPEFVLDLNAVQVGGDTQAGDALAIKNAMMLHHVEKFDGEDVGGTLEFMARHAKWRRLLLLIPPFDGWGQRLQGLKRTVAQHAKQVQIGEARVEVSGNGGAEEDDAFEVRPSGLAGAGHEFLQLVFRNHICFVCCRECAPFGFAQGRGAEECLRPYMKHFLPTAAGAAAAGTSAAETSEASAASAAEAAKSSSATPEASATAIKHTGKQNPEQKGTQWGEKDDQDNDDDDRNAAQRDMALRALVASFGGSARLRICELNSGVGGDHFGDAGGDEQQGLTVISALHQRDGFALEAAYLAVGQDGFKAVSDFDAGAAVADRVQDQNAVIGGFGADAPLVEEIDGIAIDVGAVQSIDGDYGDLRVGFLVDLAADVFHLADCAGIEDMREIIDVAGGLEIFNRLGVRAEAKRENEKHQQTELRAHVHRKIVQEGWGMAGRDKGIAMRDEPCNPGRIRPGCSNYGHKKRVRGAMFALAR